MAAWVAAGVLAVTAACGADEPQTASETTTAAPAVATPPFGLEPAELPRDEEAARALLDRLPATLAGRRKAVDGGDVSYAAPGKTTLELQIAEVVDVGIRDESPRQLLQREADTPGRTVSAESLEGSGLLYVAGRQEAEETDDTGHFLAWGAEGNPYLFAAFADTPEHLAELVAAFRHAAG